VCAGAARAMQKGLTESFFAKSAELLIFNMIAHLAQSTITMMFERLFLHLNSKRVSGLKKILSIGLKVLSVRASR
jgi:hypothetical protein